MSKKFIVKNDDTQKHYSFLYDNLVELPNGDMQTIIDFGVDANTEIDLEKPYDKLWYPNIGENGLFIQKTSKQKSFNVNPMAKPFNSIYNWYETQMTSNTTPSPLVASASSENGSMQAWRAFQTYTLSATGTDCWLTNTGEKLGWIQIDFGMTKTISQLKILSRNSTTGDKPMEFSVLGSNDGVDFTELQAFKQTSDWTGNTERIFILDNSHSFRYYRINILNNNGHSVSGLARIQFGDKREVN